MAILRTGRNWQPLPVRPYSPRVAAAIVRRALALLALATLPGCGSLPGAADPYSDIPEYRIVSSSLVPRNASYREALAAWRQPEDVNAWIDVAFEYDTRRALALSESQRAKGTAPSIHDPASFYDNPKGVCIDLARFAVETLRRIAPSLEPSYLMIEFDPAIISGQLLRRHWIAKFQRADGYYFFADSKRPGVIVGPYPSVGAFIGEYAAFRRREIVSYRELESYRRQTKVAARRRQDGS